MSEYSIENRVLSEADKGTKVTYIPTHAKGNPTHRDAEVGTLLHWNALGALVDYGWNKCRTNYGELVWVSTSDEQQGQPAVSPTYQVNQ